MLRGSGLSLIVVGAAALMLAATGCGSHKRSANQISDCIADAQHGRMVLVANRLIANGTFTRGEIVKHFPANLPPATYLDGSGRLRPYKRLPLDAKINLIAWLQALENSKASYAESLFKADTAIPASMRRRCGQSS